MNIQQIIEQYKEEFLEDLAQLVAIPSIRNLNSKEANAPFGKEIRHAFDKYMEIAKRHGFEVIDDEGYACYACLGNPNDDYIGVLGHLDVVESLDPSLWESDPFVLTERNGVLYGRGVNDDKGPLLASLYAARIVKELKLPLKYSIRVIAGGAEETTWECMHHYFERNAQPIMGFSPDGNFPIVNGEKGILQFQAIFIKKDNEPILVSCSTEKNFVCDEIKIELDDKYLNHIRHANQIENKLNHICLTYKGKKSLSRNPQRGENALWKFVEDFRNIDLKQEALKNLIRYLDKYFVDDYYGKKALIYNEDVTMGKTSICPMSIVETKDAYILNVDYRYHKGIQIDEIKVKLENQIHEFKGIFHVYNEKKMLYVDEQSKLIQSLKTAYKQVMCEEAQTLTKGGASYARTLDYGVAFGATFENEDPFPHMPNEHMPVVSLLKALEIYTYALIQLACGNDSIEV